MTDLLPTLVHKRRYVVTDNEINKHAFGRTVVDPERFGRPSDFIHKGVLLTKSNNKNVIWLGKGRSIEICLRLL